MNTPGSKLRHAMPSRDRVVIGVVFDPCLTPYSYATSGPGDATQGCALQALSPFSFLSAGVTKYHAHFLAPAVPPPHPTQVRRA